MIVCGVENISRHYGEEPVFAGLSFRIEEGERIGIVGPNGAGKTTLLRVLARLDAPDTGTLAFSADVRVGLLAQIPDFPPGRTLLAEVHQAMSHLVAWHDGMLEAGSRMAEASDDSQRSKAAKRYDHYQELLRHHGGYDFDYRIDEVLTGLGFDKADYGRDLATFSGGQQSRVLLAKLLLQAPDLMILDEPTNHLDFETTEWLEDFLNRQQAAIVLVSHDRYFLDKTITKVFELHGGRLSFYVGGYHAYVEQRAERQKVAERQSAKKNVEISRQEDYVRRNKVGQLAKQAKSREKRIARLRADSTETVLDPRVPAMVFPDATRTGDIVLSTNRLGKAFDQPLFEDVTIEIERGQRVGIVGANGAGKTTLLRILLGEEAPSTGSAKLGHQVRIGYLDQGLASLDPKATALDAVRPDWRLGERSEPFRALLARFGIGPDLAENRIGVLSGGERTRVALARLCAEEANLLALDEPTNHLDVWACDALENALRRFDGTVIVVSHDRYFLNQVVDRLLYVADGTVRVIHGSWDRFAEYKAGGNEESARDAGSSKALPDPTPTASRKAQRRFPFRKTADIEADVGAHESQIAELEASLIDPDIYKDGRKVRDLTGRLTELKTELDRLMEHWEEANELNPS